MSAQLEAMLQAARQAWPGIALDHALFVAHVTSHVSDPDAVARLHGSDLYLACACVHRLPAALAAFESAHLAGLGAALARIGTSPDFVDEVQQQLRERLLVGSPPRIAEYAGAGPLGGWVRVAAVRVALNLVRDAQKAARPRGDLVEPRHPETDLLNAPYREQVEAAFCSAFTRLRSEDRELLRLHYVEGVKQGEIGKRLGVDRTTALRRIAAARHALLEETHRQLRRLVPSLSTQGRQSVMLALQSQIDFRLRSAV